ncbi:MAG: hypothetical protein RLZZ122_660 [Actinomycetota bacterium]|jgi:hypothetical protein
MSARGDIVKLRLVLRAGATVFGLSAVLLVFLPRFFTDLLGLPGSVELDWSMQMIGLTLVSLTGNMLVVSLYGSDAGVLLSARVMQIAAFGLGVITLIIPTGINWFVVLYALVGFGFSAAYTLFLLKKSSK